MTYTIKTNNRPRLILGWHDLSKKEQAEFDWMDEETRSGGNFVRYKNWVYYINDFMRCPPEVEEFKGWDGYEADSYFSGILVKWPDKFDMDRVVMARVYC
jgi:hypothetical protein